MAEIIIYKAEAEVEGLAEKITKGTVISYEMPLEKCTTEDIVHMKPFISASLKDNLSSVGGINDSDLYYTKSILVTTNWNKNDDVFDPKEVWAARHTPTHKPTNIDHDENKMVGHITDCWAMTPDGDNIPDNLMADDLPNIYHLVNGAVIYKCLRGEELVARVNTLIEQIEKNEKFVSMECAFTNFDYAVIKDNKFSVVARDENSSFLTKHLRAFGGTGVYENAKVGRLLRNITFSGKGYVDKPANPESVILNDTNIFDFKTAAKENVLIENNGVYINDNVNNSEENKQMSEINLESKVAELTAALKEANEKLANLDVEKTKAELDTVKANVTELETKLADSVKQSDTYKTASEEAQTKIAELQTKVDEMTKAQLIASRLALLTEGEGALDKEVAQQKVDLYLNLTDEQFKDIATDLTEAAKKVKCAAKPKDKEGCKADEKPADEKPVETTAEEVNADPAVLENVKVEETPALNVTATETETVDETAATRKELQQIMASRLGITLEDEQEDK